MPGQAYSTWLHDSSQSKMQSVKSQMTWDGTVCLLVSGKSFHRCMTDCCNLWNTLKPSRVTQHPCPQSYMVIYLSFVEKCHVCFDIKNTIKYMVHFTTVKSVSVLHIQTLIPFHYRLMDISNDQKFWRNI